jgi:CzcA family heavy metal efflux pump
MRLIVAASLRFRFLVVGLAAALVFFGTASLGGQKLDVFPEFAPTQVQIQTEALGLSPSEVEELVTVPLEDGLSGVKSVDDVRSESVPQLSSIKLIFKAGTPLFEARQLVQERLATVAPTLPSWAASPVMLPPLSATSRIMAIGLSSREPATDLSMTAYWTIRARLLRVAGVANVAIWGERPKQVQVQVEPRRMQDARVSLNEVLDATSETLDAGLLRFTSGSGSVVGTGGAVEASGQTIPLRGVLPIRKPGDLARVPVARRGERTVRIGDVARVVTGHPPLIGDAVVNGGPGLLMVVEKFPGANTVAVTRGVDEALADLSPGLRGVRVDSHIFRPASFIETAIDNLSLAVLIGCFLVVVVLVAFLFEWRAAFISLVTIPLSLVAASLVLHARGVTINTMVLAGFAVAVGVVVDDAIIDTENIVRRLRRAELRSGSIARIVLAASLEVRSAILYATLINVVAVVPVLFVGGLSGAFFGPLAASYALAVLVSMLVALTVTPALAMILFSGRALTRRDPPLVRWLGERYERLLARVIRAPVPLCAALAVTVLAGLVVLPTLGQDLFPSFKERDFLMHWISKPGSSIREERRVVTRASHQMQNVDGVRSFGSHIGQAFLGEEVAGPNFGENWISVDKRADYDATRDTIRRTERGNPGLYHDVQTYLHERIDEVLAGSSEAIAVRIFGPDLHVARKLADDLTERLGSVSGLVDLHPEPQQDEPEIDVRVKLAQARRAGLKPGDIRRASATLVAGEEVGDIFRGGRIYGVPVWSTPATRANLTDIRRLPLDTPAGGHVALGQVATVRLAPTPSDIKRENASRRIDVDANVNGRDIGSATADVKQELARFRFPVGYHAEVLGEGAERQAAQGRLLLYAGAAAIVVFFLLQAAFGSWALAGLLFVTLPMALVGGLLAAFAGSGTISLGALIGFYTVLGIAARNGIMMVTHFQHLEREEGEPPGESLVLRGARERLAPILMTASATGLALLPLIVSGSRPGQEIEHPMAIVILGGLVTSTLVNLLVVPSVYLRLSRRRAARAT